MQLVEFKPREPKCVRVGENLLYIGCLKRVPEGSDRREPALRGAQRPKSQTDVDAREGRSSHAPRLT